MGCGVGAAATPRSLVTGEAAGTGDVAGTAATAFRLPLAAASATADLAEVGVEAEERVETKYCSVALEDQSQPLGLCQRATAVPGPGRRTSPLCSECEEIGSSCIGAPLLRWRITENSKVLPSASANEKANTDGSVILTRFSKLLPAAIRCVLCDLLKEDMRCRRARIYLCDDVRCRKTRESGARPAGAFELTEVDLS